MLNKVNLTTPTFKAVTVNLNKMYKLSEKNKQFITKNGDISVTPRKEGNIATLSHKDDANELSTIIRLHQDKVAFSYKPSNLKK